MSFGSPSPQYIPPPQVPQAPAPPPLLGQNKPGTKPQARSQQATFLGTGDLPTASQRGAKTLLGQ